MTGKKLLLGVVVLLVVSLVLGGIAGCCPAGDQPTPTPTAPAETPTAPAETPTAPAPGGAPTLKVGDSWTYDVSYPGTKSVDPQEGTVTASVTKAAATGYEVSFQFDATPRQEKVSPLGLTVTWMPPMIRTYNTNLDWTSMETTIDATGYGELLLDMSIDVEYPAPKWPLAEGTAWSESLEMDVGGLLQKTWELEVVVEGMEEVTVDAGTFDCYYIVWYDGGSPVIEEWVAEEVKGTVKRVEELFWRGGPDTFELTSYSVSP